MYRSPILAVPVSALFLLALALAPAVAGAAADDEPQVYDPAAATTVEVEILHVDEIDEADGRGVHLTVRTSGTDSEKITVRVGPAWYLADQQIEFAVGEIVEVTGVRMELDGDEALVAARIRRGEADWVLRDDAGQPAWARANVASAGARGAGQGMGHGRGQGQGQGQGGGMMAGEGRQAMGGGCMMHGRAAGDDEATTGQGRGQGNGMQRQNGQGRGQGNGMQQRNGQGAGSQGPMCGRNQARGSETASGGQEQGGQRGCSCGGRGTGRSAGSQ